MTTRTDDRVLFEWIATSASRRSRSTTPSSATPTTPRCAKPSARCLDDVAEDDDITVVLLRGADGVFSTGADMNNAYGWYGETRRERQRRADPANVAA